MRPFRRVSRARRVDKVDDAPKVLIGGELDDDAPSASSRLDSHPSVELLGQPLLHFGRWPACRSTSSRSCLTLVTPERYHFLGRSHRQSLGNDACSQPFLCRCVVKGNKCFGVSG